MSRYFFNVSDGQRTIRDREGTELPGLADLQRELIDFGVRVLKHKCIYGIEDPALWIVQVSNENHRVLTNVPLATLERLGRHAA
jgi:hypothetical protein